MQCRATLLAPIKEPNETQYWRDSENRIFLFFYLIRTPVHLSSLSIQKSKAVNLNSIRWNCLLRGVLFITMSTIKDWHQGYSLFPYKGCWKLQSTHCSLFTSHVRLLKFISLQNLDSWCPGFTLNMSFSMTQPPCPAGSYHRPFALVFVLGISRKYGKPLDRNTFLLVTIWGLPCRILNKSYWEWLSEHFNFLFFSLSHKNY